MSFSFESQIMRFCVLTHDDVHTTGPKIRRDKPKDLRGKDKWKKSLRTVSAKAVALIGMGSTWLHWNCSQFSFESQIMRF